MYLTFLQQNQSLPNFPSIFHSTILSQWIRNLKTNFSKLKALDLSNKIQFQNANFIWFYRKKNSLKKRKKNSKFIEINFVSK